MQAAEVPGLWQTLRSACLFDSCYCILKILHLCLHESVPNCKEEIPPQACVKSPLSSFFKSVVQGEWSETTMSICPAFSADHSCSWWGKISQRVAFCCCLLKIVNFVSSVHMIVYSVNRSSDGWAALKLRGPCRYVFCTQAEIVVGGLHSQRSSSLPCFLNQFQWLCRRQVNYVAANPGAGIL